jgi:hypothetical protein
VNTPISTVGFFKSAAGCLNMDLKQVRNQFLLYHAINSLNRGLETHFLNFPFLYPLSQQVGQRLSDAAFQGSIEDLERILSEPGVNVDTTDNVSPLFYS